MPSKGERCVSVDQGDIRAYILLFTNSDLNTAQGLLQLSRILLSDSLSIYPSLVKKGFHVSGAYELSIVTSGCIGAVRHDSNQCLLQLGDPLPPTTREFYALPSVSISATIHTLGPFI